MLETAMLGFLHFDLGLGWVGLSPDKKTSQGR